jgi:hypothetical protein
VAEIFIICEHLPLEILGFVNYWKTFGALEIALEGWRSRFGNLEFVNTCLWKFFAESFGG